MIITDSCSTIFQIFRQFSSSPLSTTADQLEIDITFDSAAQLGIIKLFNTSEVLDYHVQYQTITGQWVYDAEVLYKLYILQ